LILNIKKPAGGILAGKNYLDTSLVIEIVFLYAGFSSDSTHIKMAIAKCFYGDLDRIYQTLTAKTVVLIDTFADRA